MNFKTLALAAAVMTLPLVATGGSAVANPIKSTKFSQRVPENPKYTARQRSYDHRVTRRAVNPGIKIRLF